MREQDVYILPRHDYSIQPAPRRVKRSSFVMPRADYTSIDMNQLMETIRNHKEQSNILAKTRRKYRRKLALLLPGHNEELIIQTTIRSALAAGMKKEDIYVVDDNSNDNTRKMAMALIGYKHVLTVPRSGKAGAVYKAIKHFKMEQNYEWLHVADADSVFGKDYFRIYRKELKGKKYAVAVGFVQSLRGNWISNYRSFSYTYSQHLIRRWQSWLGMISVFPGPITCFRTDIIKDLDFKVGAIAEDFDLTLQVHRKNLGKIKFIPKAVNFTQDPQTLRDFIKQTLRWQRGFFQGVMKYKIGRRLHMIDLSIGYSLLQMVIYLLEMGVFVPYVIAATGRWIVLPIILLTDFFVVSLLAFFSSAAAKRLSILSSLPYFYFLRWLEIGIFMVAFVEIVILGRFKADIKGWDTEGRRYAVNANALKDTA